MGARWEIRQTRPQAVRPGEFYVVLIAANGEVLSTSETFPDARTAKKNADAQRRAALGAALARVRRR